MTKGLFHEPTPNHIAHTAASRALAEDADLEAWLGFNADDIFPAAAHVLEAITAYPEATSLTRSGFCFAFDTVDKEPMFVTFGKDANRARRMGKAMASLTGGEGYEVRYLLDVEGGGYDFGEVDERGGTLVDVGGSIGFVAVEMARRYRNMRFVVQDLPKTVESAPRPVDGDEQVAGRVQLMAHDFWGEQSVKGADGEFLFSGKEGGWADMENSLLLPLDLAQLLDAVCAADPEEHDPRTEAGREDHHQRPLPARGRRRESLG